MDGEASAVLVALPNDEFVVVDLVERWFAEITCQRIQRGSLESAAELVDTIEEYVRVNNETPRPNIWTKRTGNILEKLRHRRFASAAPGCPPENLPAKHIAIDPQSKGVDSQSPGRP